MVDRAPVSRFSLPRPAPMFPPQPSLVRPPLAPGQLALNPHEIPPSLRASFEQPLIHNFSPGPGQLPASVMQRAQSELLSWPEAPGMSVMSIRCVSQGPTPSRARARDSPWRVSYIARTISGHRFSPCHYRLGRLSPLATPPPPGGPLRVETQEWRRFFFSSLDAMMQPSDTSHVPPCPSPSCSYYAVRTVYVEYWQTSKSTVSLL